MSSITPSYCDEQIEPAGPAAESTSTVATACPMLPSAPVRSMRFVETVRGLSLVVVYRRDVRLDDPPVLASLVYAARRAMAPAPHAVGTCARRPA